MPPTDPPIDVTDILAQPREFAQRLARVERERAELIETVARLTAALSEFEKRVYSLCLEIERLPSGEQQTALSFTASSIRFDLQRAALRQPAPAVCTCNLNDAKYPCHQHGDMAPAQGQE